MSDGKPTEVTYHRRLPGQQIQLGEARTKELSQILAADAVRRLSQEEELNLKPERLWRMRWRQKGKSAVGHFGISAPRTYRQQHQHVERCLVICYCKHAPYTNFGSVLVMSPQLSCKHLPLKSIEG